MGRSDKSTNRIDGRKLKIAMLMGLALGLLLTITFSARDSRAVSKELAATTNASILTGLLTGFTDAARTAMHLATPPEGDDTRVEGQVPPGEESAAIDLEPADFLDASMELLLDAAREKDGLPEVTLEAGERLEFSIVPELQGEVESMYKNYRPEEAAFVAMDPRTGEILALTGFQDGEVAPHRALMADGPAASIFKIVSGAALVEKHRIRADRKFCYHGGRSGVSKRLLVQDPERDNTCLTFAEAMGKSANVVFARLANKKLSHSELKAYGEKFGFNRVLPFVWPVELSKMDIPDDKLEFARMAAGFSHSKLSPLHGALISSAVANNGMMMEPQILRTVTAIDGKVLYESKPREMMQSVSPKTAQTLTEMLITTTRVGTARKYFKKPIPAMSGITVAGKTGSLSQVKNGERYYHSWLVGFAPAHNPTIAFASLVVNGPKWRVKGPYIAKKALETYFKSIQPTSHKIATR